MPSRKQVKKSATPDGEPIALLSVKIPLSLRTRLKQAIWNLEIQQKRRVTTQMVVQDLVEQFVKKHGNK